MWGKKKESKGNISEVYTMDCDFILLYSCHCMQDLQEHVEGGSFIFVSNNGERDETGPLKG
jgi:hypothetical protein